VFAPVLMRRMRTLLLTLERVRQYEAPNSRFVVQALVCRTVNRILRDRPKCPKLCITLH
jgi:hypothetical protein